MSSTWLNFIHHLAKHSRYLFGLELVFAMTKLVFLSLNRWFPLVLMGLNGIRITLSFLLFNPFPQQVSRFFLVTDILTLVLFLRIIWLSKTKPIS